MAAVHKPFAIATNKTEQIITRNATTNLKSLHVFASCCSPGRKLWLLLTDPGRELWTDFRECGCLHAGSKWASHLRQTNHSNSGCPQYVPHLLPCHSGSYSTVTLHAWLCKVCKTIQFEEGGYGIDNEWAKLTQQETLKSIQCCWLEHGATETWQTVSRPFWFAEHKEYRNVSLQKMCIR